MDNQRTNNGEDKRIKRVRSMEIEEISARQWLAVGGLERGLAVSSSSFLLK